MTFSKDKQIHDLVRIEVANGARFQRGRKHAKLHLPGSGFVVVPMTPSDHRAAMNFRASLRAIQRRGQ